MNHETRAQQQLTNDQKCKRVRACARYRARATVHDRAMVLHLRQRSFAERKGKGGAAAEDIPDTPGSCMRCAEWRVREK